MKNNIIAVCCLVVIALLSLCGKKGKSADIVAVIGTDSLTMETVRLMVPDTGSDRERIAQAIVRYTLAGSRRDRLDSSALKLSERFSLLSAVEWSPAAAALLLGAGYALDSMVRNNKHDEIMALVDSLHKRAGAAASPRRDDLEAMKPGNRRFTELLFEAALSLSEEKAATLVSFVATSEQTQKDKIKAMVKGLVADPSARRPAPKKSIKRRIAENPALVLKYRPQSSIRDSITAHLPYLKGFYNSQLKTDELAGGVVWITFHVAPDGSVAAARIKSSEVDSRPFLLQVEDYVQKIRFLPIPDSIGPMTFEYPFEFRAEP